MEAEKSYRRVQIEHVAPGLALLRFYDGHKRIVFGLSEDNDESKGELRVEVPALATDRAQRTQVAEHGE